MERYRDLIEMTMILTAIISAGVMISRVNVRRGNRNFWFFNPFLIADYVSITREETGRIGILFWVFLIAVIGLLTFSIWGLGD